MDYKLSLSSGSSRTRNTTGADGKKTVRRRINRKRYGALLAETLPRLIKLRKSLSVSREELNRCWTRETAEQQRKKKSAALSLD